MWKVLFGTSGFFVTFLCIAIPLVIANVNDLKAEDTKMRAERAIILAERNKQLEAMTQKMNEGFTDIKVSLARLQVILRDQNDR